MLQHHAEAGRVFAYPDYFFHFPYFLRNPTSIIDTITEPRIKPGNTGSGFVKESITSSFTFMFLLNSQSLPLYFPCEEYMSPPSVPVFKYGVFSACQTT